MEPSNISSLCYTLVVGNMATLHELGTVYGVEDAYDLQEILLVKTVNDRILNAPAE